MTAGPLFVAVFLATAVEAVEATTLVLAAGTARDWRSALRGAGGALVLLGAAVGALGPAIARVPLRVVHIVVGLALLAFGLKWLRKGVLRALGKLALHDEAAAYEREMAAAAAAPEQRAWLNTDRYAFGLAFNGVLVEGLEIVFIVVSLGGNAHRTPLAALAAGIAVVVVALAGALVRAPLARVPENTMKLVVGGMLTTFGVVWLLEGLGV